MKLLVYKFSLDVHEPHSNVFLNVKRSDSNSRALHIKLTEGGFPYAISRECYAVFTATKPDGNIVFNRCSIDGNTIIYNLTPQTTAVEGIVECEIKLYGADDALITSPRFTLIVNGTVYEEGDMIESETEVTALTHLISEATSAISDARQAAEECNAIIAETEEGREELEQNIDRTEEYANSAQSSAAQAQAAAQSATQSVGQVQASAEAANTAAAQAQASANAASTTAEQAYSYAMAAMASDESAMAAAADAQNAKNNAEAHAQNAELSSNRAGEHLESIQFYWSGARDSAVFASDKAEEAKAAAEEAKKAASGMGGMGATVFVQPEEPENAPIGTLWYDTDEEMNPVARIGEVNLLASAWAGEGNLWYQEVTIEGVTENSQVDLTPSAEQLVVFYEKDLTLLTENDGGTVTVYAIGQKPMNNYTIQVTITEVDV